MRRFFHFRLHRFAWLPVFLLASVALAAPGPVSQPQEESPAAWTDEFTSEEARWDWEYQAGSGYRTLASLPEAPSLLELGITTASSSRQYSDCSLHERSADYLTGVLEMRLRMSDQDGPGTRGWGFWDGEREGGDAAWFWAASSDSDPALTGFRAQVVRDRTFLLNQPLEVDLREWHIYRIEMRRTSTRFLIDGVEVAQAPGKPAARQRVEIWVDNMAVQLETDQYSTAYMEIPQDQKMYLDWVRYIPTSGTQSPPPAPTPSATPPPVGQDNFWLALPLVTRP